MNSEENKQNAFTPSHSMSFQEQLIYKIAALDASMQSGFRRLDEKMDRFQTDLHDNQIETNDRINKLDNETTAHFVLKRARIDKIQEQMEELRQWRTVLTTRMAMVGFGAFAVWAVIGQPIQNLMGNLLGGGS
jgi:predicted  nucleic acid-binding Zn-ribbon protein